MSSYVAANSKISEKLNILHQCVDWWQNATKCVRHSVHGSSACQLHISAVNSNTFLFLLPSGCTLSWLS